MSGLKRVWMCAAVLSLGVIAAQADAAVVFYKDSDPGFGITDFNTAIGATRTVDGFENFAPAGDESLMFAPGHWMPLPGPGGSIGALPGNPFGDDVEAVDDGFGNILIRSTDTSGLDTLNFDPSDPGFNAFGFILRGSDDQLGSTATIEFYGLDDTTSLGVTTKDVNQNGASNQVFIGGISDMGDIGRIEIRQGGVPLLISSAVTGSSQVPTPGPGPGGGIPEPASMSLLAVGGLVMLRRRRSAA